ncbi:MAG TPA: hypothetical protein VF164_01770 [Trueperaceae bacterium]
MTSQTWRKLAAAALTPQVLVMLLLLVAATALLVGMRREPLPPPPTVELTSGDEALVPVDVRLVMVDATGLEWQKSERVQSRPGASARLTAVMAALRESLIDEGVWPEALPAPQVFFETIERRSVAVIDMRPPDDIAVSVATESAIARALRGTAEVNGADEVVFLKDGSPAQTLLGHVAVPNSL